MQLEKVFEYQYTSPYEDMNSLHTFYKGVNCWVEVERMLAYPERVEAVDKLVSGWESGEVELPKGFLDESQHPMTIYFVDDQGPRDAGSMSLYDFCALVLEWPFDDIPKPLRAAFIQDNEGEEIEIACESNDEESDMTEKNYKIIERAFKKIKKDLKKHYGGADFELDLVGGCYHEEDPWASKASSKETFRVFLNKAADKED